MLKALRIGTKFIFTDEGGDGIVFQSQGRTVEFDDECILALHPFMGLWLKENPQKVGGWKREKMMSEDNDQAQEKIKSEMKIETALDIATKYSFIDGAHHKNWVINEMVKALTTEGWRQEFGWNDPDWLEECIAP